MEITQHLVEQEAEQVLLASEGEATTSSTQPSSLEGSVNENNVLGKLLTFLREYKLMRYLVLCRKIDDAKLDGGTLELNITDEKVLNELKKEDFKQSINEFLTKYGLSLKFKELKQIDADKQRLAELLGGKLKIV